MRQFVVFSVSILYLQHLSCMDVATLPVNSVRANDVADICVLVPYDDSRMFSFHRVLPAVDLAVSRVKLAGYISGLNIRVRVGNTGCNSRDAPIVAFEYYRRQQVSAHDKQRQAIIKFIHSVQHKQSLFLNSKYIL